jgi:peptidoglycan hydrolase CwlO-like protein
MKRKLLTAIAIIVVIAFTLLAVGRVRNTNHQIKLRDVQLQERGAELKKLELQYENLNVELDHTESTSTERIKQLETEKQQLDAEKQRLEAELQAKLQRKEAERVAAAEQRTKLANAITRTQTASAAPQGYTGGGNKDSWLAASGIPQDQWWAVDSIVSRESGWNPSAVNKSSGACGLGQQLPCGKWAGAWNDPVAALQAQFGYVTARYGGYPQAVAFWNSNHWY